MAEARKIAAILAADMVGFSRMTNTDEDRTLAQLRALRVELVDPAVAACNGRVFKRTGDGALVEFRSIVEAVRCAVAVQTSMAERFSDAPSERRIVFRIGIHLGDVVEEADGDLMGDGVNIAARLEAIAEPGSICLSEDAYRQVKARLDLGVTDLGLQKLKNIAEPIRAYSLRLGKSAHEKPTAVPSPESSAPPRLSLAVLPFVNIGGGEEYEYFVDGVTECLTTDLSRIRGAVVIARNTAFTFKGYPVDVKAVGRELNVRYVLEGSVQRGGSRMRVNVQLIDASSGSHIWAERFDKPVADLFDIQDEIVARLASTLNVELIAAEARRAERNPNPDLMDLQLRALACLYKGHSLENRARTRDLCARALELDPNNIEALVTSASADVTEAMQVAEPIPLLAEAERKLTEALRSVPNHPGAHVSLALVYICTGRVAQGIAESEHALSLNRNLASAHSWIGLGKMFLGRPEETEAHVLEALRLSPRDPLAHIWMMTAGSSKNLLGRWEDAVAWSRRAIETNRTHPQPHIELAIALAQMGRVGEARASIATVMEMIPNFSISHGRAAWTAICEEPAWLAEIEAQLQVLRAIGVPE